MGYLKGLAESPKRKINLNRPETHHKSFYSQNILSSKKQHFILQQLTLFRVIKKWCHEFFEIFGLANVSKICCLSLERSLFWRFIYLEKHSKFLFEVWNSWKIARFQLHNSICKNQGVWILRRLSHPTAQVDCDNTHLFMEIFKTWSANLHFAKIKID